jgi:hypothetical protein
MHHKIINALARPGINLYYGIQNRELLFHLSLKDLFGCFPPFEVIFTSATFKIELPLLVGTML